MLVSVFSKHVEPTKESVVLDSIHAKTLQPYNLTILHKVPRKVAIEV